MVIKNIFVAKTESDHLPFLEVFANVSQDQWNNVYFYDYNSSLHAGNLITHFLNIQMPQKV